MTWTAERVETLKKLWADGLSCSQIAAELGGCTRNGVIGKVTRLGLDTRKTLTRTPRKPQTYRPRPRRPQSNNPFGAKGLPHGDIEPASEPTEATDLPPDTATSPVTVVDVQEHHCRWPIGDPQSADFVFCGGDKHRGETYCLRHCRLAYQRATVRRERRRAA